MEKLPAFDDDAYRAVLRVQAGVNSSTDLDNDGCTSVLRWFEEQGFKNTAKKRRWSNPKPLDPVTPEQQEKMRALYTQLGWTEISRQMGFNKRVTRSKAHPAGLSWPQTRSDATKVIEGLKAMIKRASGTLQTPA
jgi:hypothetical protein